MGLDMYLRAEISYPRVRYYDNGQAFVREPVAETQEMIRTLNLAEVFGNDEAAEIYDIHINSVVAYWRKANHIHKWFVDNIQDGEDNCQTSYVGIDDLAELRDLCREVARRKNQAYAEEHLPTEAGFFFGSQDYDEYYWSSLESTATRLDQLLELASRYPISFEYQASW